MPHVSTESEIVRLSVAMIVRDAEEVLADSLAGLDQVADEIVVVDTGSTDRSREIARNYKARVIEADWTDDFSAARNTAIDAACGRWVLWLDAGEQLTDEAAQAIREFIDTDPDATSAYLMIVQMPPTAPGAPAEQVSQVRLMPRLTTPVFSRRVRETARPALLAAGLQTESTPWRIVRHQKVHDPQVRKARAERDLQLAQSEIGQRGLDPVMLTVRGEAYMALGERRQAAAAFYQALRLCQRGTIDMLEAYYGLLTTFVGDETDRDQQLAICLEALEVFPLDAQLLCAMGNYLQAQNRWDLAARSFQAATEHGAVETETWHLRDIRATAAACWSLICQIEGDPQRAETVLQSALARLGDAPQLRRHLIHLHIKRGRLEEALEQMDQLPADTPHREALRSAVRGACLVAEKNWVPALAYLETAHAAGCRDSLLLKWLFVALISTDRQAEAEAVLGQWQAVEPHHPEIAQYQAALEAGWPGDGSDTVPVDAIVDSAVDPDASPVSQRSDKLRIDTANDQPAIAAPPVKTATTLAANVSNPPAEA